MKTAAIPYDEFADQSRKICVVCPCFHPIAQILDRGALRRLWTRTGSRLRLNAWNCYRYRDWNSAGAGFSRRGTAAGRTEVRRVRHSLRETRSARKVRSCRGDGSRPSRKHDVMGMEDAVKIDDRSVASPDSERYQDSVAFPAFPRSSMIPSWLIILQITYETVSGQAWSFDVPY
jgi:hypothetical protein